MHITYSQIHWPSFTIEVIGVSIPEKRGEYNGRITLRECQ